LLSSASNTITVESTAQDSTTYIRGQDNDDFFYIKETIGDLNLFAGGGQDQLYVYGLGEKSTARLFGDNGNDTLIVDGTGFTATKPVNSLQQSTLQWDGGVGQDTATIQLSSVGDFTMDILGDTDGMRLTVYCDNYDSVMLSRVNFLANIHNTSHENSTIERINLLGAARLNSIAVFLGEGNNSMYFDDTMAAIDVFGGSSSDGTYRARFSC